MVNCDLSGYQKGGMALSGDYLTANVDGCNVQGYGPADFIAQNGIQIGYGATGSIGATPANTVSGHSYTPHTWAASGILLSGSGGTVQIKNNVVSQNSEGIYSVPGSATIQANTVTATQVGTGVADYYGIICDPGTAPSMPKPQPLADLLPKGGLGIQTQSFKNNVADGDFQSKGSFGTYAYSVNDNVIDGDDGDGSVGLFVWCSAGDNATLTGSGNTVTDFDYGVYVDEELPGLVNSMALNYSSIYSNIHYGLYNDASLTVNAENNWWGHPSGPYHPTLNPGGLGNAVSDNVDFDPYMSAPPNPTPDFYVSLRVRAEDGYGNLLQDGTNYAGMNAAAHLGFDTGYDYPEPPIAPGGVALYYDTDYLTLPPFPERFRTDIRDADSLNLSLTYDKWDVYVVNQCSSMTDTVFMDYSETSNLPGNYSVILTNEAGTVVKDLRFERPTWAVTTAPLHLFLYIGTGVPYGRLHHFKIANPGTRIAGADFALQVTARDSADNLVMDYDGAKTLTFSGASPSPSSDNPTVNGTVFGSDASVTFTDGIGTPSAHFVKDEDVTLSVTDGPHGCWYPPTFDVDPAPAYRLWFTGGSGSQIAGAANVLQLTAEDQYWNVCNEGVNNYAGDKSLTFSGAASNPAPCSNAPTVTDKVGAAVAFGSPTTITFINGVSSAGGSMILYKEEAASVGVAGGGVSEKDPLVVTVTPAASNFLLVRDGGGGGGGVAGSHVMTTDSTWTLYAADYDAYCNYKSDVAATWSKTGTLEFPGGSGASITYAPAHTACVNDSGRIVATWGSEADTTGKITVGFGALSSLSISPASWNQNIRTNRLLRVVARDGDGNQICPDTLNWSLDASVAWGLVDPGLPAGGSWRDIQWRYQSRQHHLHCGFSSQHVRECLFGAGYLQGRHARRSWYTDRADGAACRRLEHGERPL